jgi:hypothetical protein
MAANPKQDTTKMVLRSWGGKDLVATNITGANTKTQSTKAFT